MRGRRMLHLGHRDADCDALGSAYALSCLLPGDIGFVGGLKASACDLAAGLGATPVIDPDPEAYDYVVVYDTPTWELLGIGPLSRYALLDHHVAGGHSYGDFRSQLAENAEWCWVRPLESTCSILTDLILGLGLPIGRKMGVALAAGIVTDTAWLRLADGAAFQRLANLFASAGLRFEDVMAAIDSPARRVERRRAVLLALRAVQETLVGRWSILAAETDSHDHGFALCGTLGRLGGDVRVVAFPKDGMAMAMIEGDGELVDQTGIDLAKVSAQVARSLDAWDTWGTRIWGRVLAQVSMRKLLDMAVSAVVDALGSGASAENSC